MQNDTCCIKLTFDSKQMFAN